jgi:dienelactone hydrolase
MSRRSTIGAAVAVIAFAALATSASADPMLPERVSFPSSDGHTMLVGYLYTPVGGGRHPAVVMMHGRAGAYSSLADGRYDAATLSQRHQMWGRFWAAQGYVAVLVDGFGPRGYPGGFGRFSYDQRPPELSEVTVRPLDAYGALAWLRRRPDVISDRIGLQGWSNGGSAVLATMAAGTTRADLTPATGFRAALSFYPGCGLKGEFDAGLRPYAPVRVLQGDADEEVSPRRCADLVEKSLALGGDIALTLYPGATHSFDDPGRNRQSMPANAIAKDDAMMTAQRFFAAHLSADQRAGYDPAGRSGRQRETLQHSSPR